MPYMKDVLGLILGGGQGARLYPLTKERSKPAVPLKLAAAGIDPGLFLSLIHI